MGWLQRRLEEVSTHAHEGVTGLARDRVWLEHKGE